MLRSTSTVFEYENIMDSYIALHQQLDKQLLVELDALAKNHNSMEKPTQKRAKSLTELYACALAAFPVFKKP